MEPSLIFRLGAKSNFQLRAYSPQVPAVKHSNARHHICSLCLSLTPHLCIYLATPLTNKHLIPLFGLGLQNIFSAPCISPMGLGKIFTITQSGTRKNSTISSHMYISVEKEKLTTRYNTSPETLLPPAHRCRRLHHRCSRRR